jgi:selenophosphate synthetase-related protein
MITNQLDILYQKIKNGEFGTNSRSVRDLTVIQLTDTYSLVMAVDSDGGIGSLDGDTIKCDPYQLGRFAMRVPLLELLSCGAIPIAAFDMLTIPMIGPGEEIVRGVRDELNHAGLPADFPLSGSTEDNVPTIMTGIGTTIVGMVDDIDFRPSTSLTGDIIICAGIPKSAPEDIVLLDDPQIINQKDVLDLINIEGVHEILPIGSKGIEYEAGQMAKLASLTFVSDSEMDVDISKSGGPSTCVIVSCTSEGLVNIRNKISVPINKVGVLI